MQRLRQCAPRQYYVQLGRTAQRGHACIFWQAQRFFSVGRNLLAANDDNVEVRWFEQTGPSRKSIKPLRVGRGNEVLKAKIERLEHQIQELKSGEIKELFTAEEKEQLQKRLEPAKAEGQLPKDLNLDDLVSEVSKDIKVDLRLPKAQTQSLIKLNDLLRECDSRPLNPRISKQLWIQYAHCKQISPGFEEQLSSGAWEVLWKSQYDSPPSDARARHLCVLIEDMHDAGEQLNVVQRMMRIEALVAGNRHSEALNLWHEERAELQDSEDVAEVFLHLGPRLEALVGRPQDAERLALEISKLMKHAQVSLFIPVIEAWLRQGSETSLKRAWALYLHVRHITGSSMSPGDYDKMVLCFLNGGQTELALGVFKDLVLAGTKSSYDSTELYEASKSIYSEILDRNPSPDSLNKFSLTALAVLPRRFQNKFFYASWMKRLIGMGEIEAAASVLELMYHRGVRPDPKHINGLMSAWFRRGHKKDKELAINVGWAMIKERLNFVVARRAVASGQPIPPVSEDPTASLPPYLGRSLPAATIETFSILLLYYSRANMPISVQQLQDTLSAAELQPNTYFLNHLLYSHLRSGDPGAVWELYCTATSAPAASVAPDLETFACLWDTCKAHLTTHAPGPGQKFPGPRTLYRHMSTWLNQLPTTPSHKTTSQNTLAAAQSSFTEDLYTQIIRCFCLARDLPGTLAALYSLRDTFNFYPTEHAIRLVSIQVARSGEPLVSLKNGPTITTTPSTPDSPPTKTKFRRRAARFSDSRMSQANLAKVAEVQQILERERRAFLLASKGIKPEDLTEDMRGEENLWLLGAFLREVIKGRISSGSERPEEDEDATDTRTESSDPEAKATQKIEKVAWDMGVGGLRFDQAPEYEWDEDERGLRLKLKLKTGGTR